jgi:hypothetical protein
MIGVPAATAAPLIPCEQGKVGYADALVPVQAMAVMWDRVTSNSPTQG